MHAFVNACPIPIQVFPPSIRLLRVCTGFVLLQCANGGVIRGILGEMVSQVDQCPAPSLNRKVRKNYPPHLFVWQLINICFDRFSCRYIFNPISKDWPFVRSGQLDAGPASLSFTKGKAVINQSQHSIYPLLYVIIISRLHAKSTDNLLSP